ncbi:hypothetical protein [Burkholderia gladioli]|uniref:hypothetical protein n=1 Tax=Burkholderia gladioli TaxID=28095 RepID=UPI0018C8BC00|nr:hypothetical protein [Burkholderia gladioli]
MSKKRVTPLPTRWSGNKARRLPRSSQRSRCSTATARAFTDAEGEVAYTPRGLDVLAKLAALCGTLRARLELEINGIQASATSFADLLGEHAAGRSLATFDKRSHLPAYRKELATLATLSDEDLAEILRLTVELAETNPAARAADLRGKKARIDGLAIRWERCETALSVEKAGAAIEFGAAVVAAETAVQLAAEAFAAEGGLLPGTGSDPWRALLSAAREFSTTLAYPGHHFPHVDGGRCVLCQQDLAAAAAERMRHFETFVEQEAQNSRKPPGSRPAPLFPPLPRLIRPPCWRPCAFERDRAGQARVARSSATSRRRLVAQTDRTRRSLGGQAL